MKKQLLSLLILVFLVGMTFANAESDFSKDVEQLGNQLLGQELPAKFKILFGNERINIHFTLADGSAITAGIATQDNKIVQAGSGAVENPSLDIYTDEATVRSLVNSDNPVPELKKALDDKKITYKAIGFKNKVKFAFLSAFSKVSSLFISEKVNANVEKKNTTDLEAPKQTEELKEIASPVATPTATEKSQEEPKTTEVTEAAEATETEPLPEETEVAEVAPSKPKKVVHAVNLVDGGFEFKELTVKVGETVMWQNVREGKYNKAMILGTGLCTGVKSSFFNPGEVYSYTFTKPGVCNIADGIYTRQMMKVIVMK